jgi:hypothetical protein
MEARQNLDQGRFAGPVLADQSAYLSRLDGKADTVEHSGTAEAFREVRDRENGSHAASCDSNDV